MKHQIAVFASGSGSNAEALVDHFANHTSIKVSLIVTNKANAGVIDRAKRLGVEYVFVPKEDIEDEEMMLGLLDNYDITHVVLAGWLLLIPPYLIKRYQHKILNIHPALLPKFGGKGMYGHHVHKAVKEAGETESGITIHLVNEKYDEGAIVKQHKVALVESDSAADIETKVRKLELEHYAQDVENFILEPEK